MTDILDTFARECAHAATLVSYGEGDTVTDPLLRAAGEVYIAHRTGDRSPPHPHASNGAMRFAVYVPAKGPNR